MELTEKEIKALLFAIYYVQDKIDCDGREDVGFTVEEAKAIERGRVKLAKLLDD
jgi:hypothetical protein